MVTRKLQAMMLLAGGLFLFGNIAFAKDLILTAPPRENPAVGNKQYGPIAAHLTRLLGKRVAYQHPGNWLSYQRDMRADKYDIIFDGPHFIAWRMAHLGHETLIRLPGSLIFYLVVKADSPYKHSSELIAKRICGLSPPNLTTLAVAGTEYPNPVQQPVITGVKGGMGAVFKTLMASDRCQAAVLRDSFYKKKLKPEQKKMIRIIHTTKPLPNQAISVSSRLTMREKNLVVQSLTLGDGIKVSLPIVKRFAKKAKVFILAENNDYKGHHTLLEGVIFGW